VSCAWRVDNSEEVPVARPYDGVTQPMVVMDHPVSVWGLVEAGDESPGVEDLARLLRRVHGLSNGPCDVPELDPLVHAEPRISGIAGFSCDDRAFLSEWCERMREEYKSLEFALPQGFVHGDAHTGNLLGGAGRAVLTDFEMTAIGPREWDLTPIAVAHARMGLGDARYRRFVNLYGFDVTEWAGFGVLRQIRELDMIAWLAQNLGESQAVVDEVALRIASIRDGDTDREWHAF
jgi:hypothetical protein